MSDSKSKRPGLSVAPEFVGLGRLAGILTPGTSPARPANRIEPQITDDDNAWTVFGVGAIWQTAAENAARLDGCELGEWLSLAVKEAAETERKKR